MDGNRFMRSLVTCNTLSKVWFFFPRSAIRSSFTLVCRIVSLVVAQMTTNRIKSAETSLSSLPMSKRKLSMFRSESGPDITYTYSVTNHSHAVSSKGFTGDAQQVPGVFFVYDFSPFIILTSTHERPTIWSLLTSLCAVIGGAVTIAGLFDSLIYYGGQILRGDKSVLPRWPGNSQSGPKYSPLPF